MAHDNGRKLVFQLTGAFAEFERPMFANESKQVSSAPWRRA
jgi:hypothetical protein